MHNLYFWLKRGVAKTVGIITPNVADPDGLEQLRLLTDQGCSMIFQRSGRHEHVFRAEWSAHVEEGDLIIACELHNLGRNFVELLRFLRFAMGRKLHIMTLDGRIDSRLPSTHSAIEALLSTATLYFRERSVRNHHAAKSVGNQPGRKNHFNDEDWPRIYNKLLIKPLSTVAVEEGVSRATIYKFRERMTGK
jgi:DNA invertase Pin-like site-specific DNA recombinase